MARTLRRYRAGRVFRDDRGFTTEGMVVALLVSLALIFTSAQVYRIQAASADIQDVADAAALAAENEVAEFMIAVRVCDAVVLSLTLLGTVCYGVGTVALCIPPTAALGSELIDVGGKIFHARDVFADHAANALNTFQKALPFLAAVQAAGIASANSGGPGHASYVAIAMLVPFQGKEIRIGEAKGAEELKDTAEEQALRMKELAEKTERLSEEANEIKKSAFLHDCGYDPKYCMYERAKKLAGMQGATNPLYTSPDAWSFSVALERAKAYYPERRRCELPVNSSIREQANSSLRRRFYEFASKEVAKGYVHEGGESFEAYFPHLPKNTSEMRSTVLFTEVRYPITGEGEHQTMHAWAGCPRASEATRKGSLAELDAGKFETCDRCAFTVSSMGKVAAASTSIENGFEYHYEAVARAAEEYERKRHVLDPLLKEVKDKAGGVFSDCLDVLKGASGSRITSSPPGEKGCIALVANIASVEASSGFESGFVRNGATLGARAAVSGSTLIEDTSDEQKTVINSVLDGLTESGGAVVGVARVVLDAWSWLLKVYGDGYSALRQSIVDALDGLPLMSSTGLGQWAARRFTDAVAFVGLQPAKLQALKPVLVNSAHVAAQGEDGFSVRFASIQQRALRLPASSTDLFVSLIDDIESEALDVLEKSGEGIVIARIELPFVGSLPITVVLPPSAREGGKRLVDQAVGALRSLYGSIAGVLPWQ